MNIKITNPENGEEENYIISNYSEYKTNDLEIGYYKAENANLISIKNKKLNSDILLNLGNETFAALLCCMSSDFDFNNIKQMVNEKNFKIVADQHLNYNKEKYLD